MTPASKRPFTPDERRQLEAMVAAPSWWSEVLGRAAYVTLFAWLAAAIVGDRLLLVKTHALAVDAALAAGAVAYFARWRARVVARLRASPWHASLRADLEGGVAELVRCRARDALRIQEHEDEGTAFFVRLDDGRVLFFVGQYLYELEEDRFPATEFDVVRSPRSTLLLGIEPRGSYLPPSGRLGPFSRDDVRAGRVPGDGDVVPVRWEEIEPRWFGDPRPVAAR